MESKDTVGRNGSELGREEEQCLKGEEKGRGRVGEGLRWPGEEELYGLVARGEEGHSP